MSITVKMQTPDGKTVDKTGDPVKVKTQIEEWNIYELEDGTKIRTKQSLVQILKLQGETDTAGNPVYFLQSAPIMLVDPPAKG
jgi:hypothetical protein